MKQFILCRFNKTVDVDKRNFRIRVYKNKRDNGPWKIKIHTRVFFPELLKLGNIDLDADCLVEVQYVCHYSRLIEVACENTMRFHDRRICKNSSCTFITIIFLISNSSNSRGRKVAPQRWDTIDIPILIFQLQFTVLPIKSEQRLSLWWTHIQNYFYLRVCRIQFLIDSVRHLW